MMYLIIAFIVITASIFLSSVHGQEYIILPPLKQFKNGVNAYEIQCNDNLHLVIKDSNRTPACVKDTSVKTLWNQGWVSKSTDIYMKYSDDELLKQFKAKLIDKEKALQIVEDYVDKNNLVLDVDRNNPDFQIITSLAYISLSNGYSNLLDVDPNTGLPLQIMPPWWETYYRNPQWWGELEKDYLGMKSNRLEEGNLAWIVDYRVCLDCASPYPSFAVDAITGKIIRDHSVLP